MIRALRRWLGRRAWRHATPFARALTVHILGASR